LVFPDQAGTIEPVNTEPLEDGIADLRRDLLEADLVKRRSLLARVRPEDKFPKREERSECLVERGFKDTSGWQDHADGILPQQLDQPLVKFTAGDCPDGELVAYLIIGLDIDHGRGDELDDPPGDILINICTEGKIDQFPCRSPKELHAPDVLFPLGDILEYQGAPFLSVLERGRDHLQMEEVLLVGALIPDISDDLFVFHFPDEREGFW